MTRIIAVASGKGGTGKTTTAVNLAVALHDLGRNVILCDANFSTPNVCMHLGVEMPSLSVNEALKYGKGVMESVYLHPSGLKFIPNSGAYIVNENYVDKFPALMLELIGKCEIVLLDLGPSFTKDKIAALKSADETLVVTNPELTALVEAKKVIKAAEELGSVVIGVLINKAKKNYNVPMNDIERYMKKTILGIIPEDANVAKSLFIQHPVIYSSPNCPASKEFRRIAETLII